MVNNNSILLFQEIEDKYKLKNMEVLEYLQVQSCLMKNVDSETALTEIGGEIGGETKNNY